MKEKERDHFTGKMLGRLLVPSMVAAIGLAAGDMADAVVIGQRMGGYRACGSQPGTSGFYDDQCTGTRIGDRRFCQILKVYGRRKRREGSGEL